MSWDNGPLNACVKCDAHAVQTINSRPTKNGRMRRYKCTACGHRWSTIESIVESRHLRDVLVGSASHNVYMEALYNG